MALEVDVPEDSRVCSSCPTVSTENVQVCVPLLSSFTMFHLLLALRLLQKGIESELSSPGCGISVFLAESHPEEREEKGSSGRDINADGKEEEEEEEEDPFPEFSEEDFVSSMIMPEEQARLLRELHQKKTWEDLFGIIRDEPYAHSFVSSLPVCCV
jgi:hypothetical protein